MEGRLFHELPKEDMDRWSVGEETDWWQCHLGIVEIMNGDTDLLEIIDTGSSPSGLTSGLNSREQESDQSADDRNDDKKFDKGKSKKSTFPAPPHPILTGVFFIFAL